MSHFQKGWLIFCSVVLRLSDTIHKHYYPLNDASMAAEGELDAMQPSPGTVVSQRMNVHRVLCARPDAGHRYLSPTMRRWTPRSTQPAPPRNEVVVSQGYWATGFEAHGRAYAPAFDERGVELEEFVGVSTNDTRWGDYDFQIMHGAQWCGPCQLILRALDEDARDSMNFESCFIM